MIFNRVGRLADEIAPMVVTIKRKYKSTFGCKGSIHLTMTQFFYLKRRLQNLFLSLKIFKMNFLLCNIQMM